MSTVHTSPTPTLPVSAVRVLLATVPLTVKSPPLTRAGSNAPVSGAVVLVTTMRAPLAAAL